MELRHLRYFVAVAEELHFTRAAERLHIGQPPLSMQIQSLEAELGVKLFRRHQRKVELTRAGEQFLPRARQILADTEHAAQIARRADKGEVGELSIGFTSSLPMSPILHASLSRYRLQFPQVRLVLQEMFTDSQIEALQKQQLDIGFVRFQGDIRTAGIVLQELQRDPLRVVINSQHSLAGADTLSMAQLKNEGLICYPAEVGTGLHQVVRNLSARSGVRLKVVQEASEVITQIGLVASGLGIAILPSTLECIRMAGVNYIPLIDEEAYLSVGVAYRQDDESPLVRQFLGLLAAG